MTIASLIVVGDVEWFSRYMMGAYWLIVGMTAVGHGVMRWNARRPEVASPALGGAIRRPHHLPGCDPGASGPGHRLHVLSDVSIVLGAC
jgi:hypothetical protein